MELGVILGLGSAVAFGGGDFAGGTAARRASAIVVAGGAQAVGFVLLAVLLWVAGAGPVEAEAIGFGALAGLFGGVGLVALYRGLAMGGMGVVTAISGVGSVLIPLFVSVAIHRASIVPLQWIGIGCALAAAAAASGATLRGIRPAAIALAGVAAVGFGTWFVLLDLGARSDELWTLVASRGAATLVVGGLAVVRTRTGPARGVLPLVLLAGTLDVAGNTTFVLARGILPVGIAAALAGLYPLVTMILARVALGESLPRLGLLAVVLAVAGIVLISAGG